LPTIREGAKSQPINPTQKQFSLNRAASKGNFLSIVRRPADLVDLRESSDPTGSEHEESHVASDASAV